MISHAARNYQAVVEEVRRSLAGESPSGKAPRGREACMRFVVDALWKGLHDRGVSWIGFYIDAPGEPDDRRMVLGFCRDKPACSPIGLRGVCGQALLSRQTRIVRDVRELGDNYIACDARDRSEIAVPLIDAAGTCWGVLDADSHDVGSFDESDDAGLKLVLLAAGLLAPGRTESIRQS